MGIAPKDLVDFHAHSTVSDGTFKPFELILQAQKSGVRMVALTDHDTIAGLDSFLAAAGRFRIHAVPGIEISSDAEERRLHILGLGLRRHLWGELEGFLAAARRWRTERNEKMLERLNALGLALTMSEVEAHCGSPIVARPHFARALTEAGHVATLQQAFDELLGVGCPAYVRKQRPSPAAAVSALQAAGGVAMVAHPSSLVERDNASLTDALTPLLEAGIDGIEVYHPDMTEAQSDEVLKFAQQHDLLVSGGSDFHGRNKPRNRLGRAHGARKIFAQQVAELVARFEPFVRW